MIQTERRAVAVAALLLLASLVVLVHPWYVRNADAAMYIATARSLAAGEGYRYLGEPFLVRPPGFSLLLAPVIALGGGSNFLWMNALVGLTGALGVAGLYALSRARLGWPLALAIAAALWLNPGYQRLCSSILSDVPGAAAALGCLWWAARRQPGPSDWRAELGLGVAIGLAVWLRSANALLIPAIALGRWLAPRPGGEVVVAAWRAPLIALVIASPWFVYGSLHATGEPADQTRLSGYATAMLHEDPGDPTSRRLAAVEIAGRAPQRTVQLLAVLGSRLGAKVRGGSHDPRESDARPVRAVELVLGALLLVALAREALRARGAPAWFALGSGAVLLFYFGFQDRLVLPVFALGLCALAAWLRDVFGTVVTTATVLVLALFDFAPRQGWSEIEADHQRMASESAAVEPLLEPGDRIASWRGFHHSIFLDRPVYSLHRSVGRLGARAGIEAVLGQHEINVVFLTLGGLAEVRNHLNHNYGPPRTSPPATLWKTRASGAGR